MPILYRYENIFYAFKDLGDDVAEMEDEDIIEIDDEIMLFPILELNNKGYMTKFCCSSHPFGSPIIIDSLDKDLNEYKKDNRLIQIKKVETQERDFAVLENDSDNEIYISFEKNFLFHDYPKGWQYDSKRNIIFSIIKDENNKWEQYKKIVEQIDNLMIWIEQLPNLKNK